MKKQFVYFELSLLAISFIFIITANINREVGRYTDTIKIAPNGESYDTIQDACTYKAGMLTPTANLCVVEFNRRTFLRRTLTLIPIATVTIMYKYMAGLNQ